MPEAKSVQEVADALDLTSISKRVWYIQACSASTGDGISSSASPARPLGGAAPHARSSRRASRVPDCIAPATVPMHSGDVCSPANSTRGMPSPLPSGGTSGALLVCRGALQLHQAQLSKAVETLESGLVLARQSAVGYELLGKAQMRLGDAPKARAAFERALELSAQPYPLGSLLLLGQLCLGSDNARAKEVYMHAARQAPSCSAWFGVGAACFKLGAAAEAELALSEANVHNNKQPLVWGVLALLCVERHRFDEAADACTQAYRLELADPGLLLLLAVAWFGVQRYDAAEVAVRKALALHESCAGFTVLGDILTEGRHLYEEAAVAYRKALGGDGAPSSMWTPEMLSSLSMEAQAAADLPGLRAGWRPA